MESVATFIVGRESEQAVLSSFIAAPGGQALVLQGETGVGKSALLEHAAQQAASRGYRVIRAVGVEAESALPFAGLHQLLYPLLQHVGHLDAMQQVAFDVVLGRSHEQAPSVMALGIAVLDLVTAAASQDRILLLLDDAQSFDAASAEVIGFVGRRLASNTVKLLIALRSDIASGFDTSGLPALPVVPLSEDDAARLLDTCQPHVDGRVRRLVLDQAQGNPLALMELPQYLGRSVGGPSMDETSGYGFVSLPERFRQVYGARIGALEPALRGELLRGALDGVHAGSTTGIALAARYRMTGVDEVAAAGLVHVDPLSGEFVFRHPLVRSMVVRLSTPNERRSAHTALAQVHRDDVERRATHLAAAAVDPDEEVAGALEAAAASAIRRGGAAAAVSWLTRAAELSPAPEDRSRRLGDAAFVATHAGLLDQAQRLVGSGHMPGGAETVAAVLAFTYAALYRYGDVRSSHGQLRVAIERIRDGGGAEPSEELTRLVDLLMAVSQYAGDGASWQETHHLLDSLGGLVSPVSRIYQDAWCDVVRRGAGVGERVATAFTEFSNPEPWDITRLAVAAYHVDTLSHYRSHLVRSVERERQAGATGAATTMLHLIMLDQLAVGEWQAAEQTGLQALDLSEANGNMLFAHQSRAYLALLAALRGQLDRARELQALVDRWARPRRIGFLTQITDAVGAATALSEGDYEAAYLSAIGVTAPGTFEFSAHQAPRTILDLIEAALHTGRREQARRHALAAREAALPQISPRLAVVTFGALAMTAEDDAEAAAMFRRVVEHPAAGDIPFELARISLAYGSRLRRSQGPKAARPVLGRAVEIFERLGSEAWARRAGGELRTCGVPGHHASTDLSTLTWQERRIADLAARGLTNKEIGEQMHLSPRTVSSHLYRVFPKLGITSRAALRDALAGAGAPAD